MRIHEYKDGSYIYPLLLALGVWQLLSMVLQKNIFPSPIDIVINIIRTFYGEISIHALFSLGRIIIGVLVTLMGGVPLGIFMGYFEKADKIFSSLLYFSYPVPKIALLPIVMLVFGLGEITKVVMIFLITFFPIVVNIRDEVKNIPDEVYYPMYSLGANNFQIIKEIILPGILPTILTSIRISIGTAISVLFFTENFGTAYGMGYYIMDSWMRINYIQMYSGIVVLGLIGLIFFMVIDILEIYICPWRG